MTLAYILDRSMTERSVGVPALYDTSPVMRECYENVGMWTGLDVAQILPPSGGSEADFRRGLNLIRQAAAVTGTHDVLADEYGIRPGVICGLSFGAMMAACLAGSIERADLFQLLMRLREAPPPPPGPPQGNAAVALPAETLVEELLGDGLYLAVDHGHLGPDRMRMVLLAGHRTALSEVTDRLPAGASCRILEDLTIAVHTPLQQYLSDYLEPYLAAIEMRDPTVPICSSIEPRILTTAGEVRDMLLRNFVSAVIVPYLRSGLEQLGTRLGLVLGPSQLDADPHSPFPIMAVETSEHIVEAVSAIYELGIELPTVTR